MCETHEIDDRRPLRQDLQQVSVAALLQRPLPGELRDGRAQLPFQPFLLAGQVLHQPLPLGVIAAVGGGEDQPGQPRPRLAPGCHCLLDCRIGPDPAQHGGLATAEDLRQGRFPVPDPTVRFFVAGGQAKGRGNQAIAGRGQLGQVIHRLGFRGRHQQRPGQGMLHVRALTKKVGPLSVRTHGEEQYA